MKKRSKRTFVPTCPKCDNDSVGQFDIVQCTADIMEIDEDGDITWGGETDVDWNSQEAQSDPARWVCATCGYIGDWNEFLPEGAVKELQ